jgi:hypothetical protein
MILYDKLYFPAVYVTKTISTSTWDCTPDRIYGKWMNEWIKNTLLVHIIHLSALIKYQ